MALTTELFVYAFGAKETEPRTADRIRATGEIPQRLMNKICSSEDVKPSDNRIPTSEIVELLASRYILYENVRSANEETSYFLPSLLLPDHNVAKESSDPALLSALFYSPILLWPFTGFVPLGLFPATVVKLSQYGSWSLDECNRFRNRIRFYVQYRKEKLLHVELRTLSTHLEFRIVSTTPVNPRLIPVVRKELWNAIIEVSSLYQHTQDVKWRYGFYCPHSVSSCGRPHPALCRTMEEPQDVVCSLSDCHGGPVGLEDRHKCWFMVIQINTDSDRDGKLKESTTADLPSSVASSSSVLVPTSTSGTILPSSVITATDPALNKPPTMRDLMRKVARRAMDKWRIIGIELNLEQHQLRAISQSHHHDAIQCYIEVFSLWENKADPPFTWATIINALRSPIVEENALVEEIEDWITSTTDT